jgi:hypothetical protein
MSGDEAAVVVTLILTAGVTVISVARMYMKHLDAKMRGGAHLHAGAAEEQRLARIEQAVDAIALEVERMSEGQRFTTRLLADRMGEANAISPGPRGGDRHGGQ